MWFVEKQIPIFSSRSRFWRDAFTIRGSVTLFALHYVISFGIIASIVCLLEWLLEYSFRARFVFGGGPL